MNDVRLNKQERLEFFEALRRLEPGDQLAIAYWAASLAVLTADAEGVPTDTAIEGMVEAARIFGIRMQDRMQKLHPRIGEVLND